MTEIRKEIQQTVSDETLNEYSTEANRIINDYRVPLSSWKIGFYLRPIYVRSKDNPLNWFFIRIAAYNEVWGEASWTKYGWVWIKELKEAGFIDEKDEEKLLAMINYIRNTERNNPDWLIATAILWYLVKEKGLEQALQSYLEEKANEVIIPIVEWTPEQIHFLLENIDVWQLWKKLADYNLLIKEKFWPEFMVFYDGRKKVVFNVNTGEKIGSFLGAYNTILEGLADLLFQTNWNDDKNEINELKQEFLNIDKELYNDSETIKWQIKKFFGTDTIPVINMKYNSLVKKIKKLEDAINQVDKYLVVSIWKVKATDLGVMSPEIEPNQNWTRIVN